MIIHRLYGALGLALSLLAFPALAGDDGLGQKAEDRLDARGDRIERHTEHRGEVIDRHLDRRADRVERRSDAVNEKML